MQFNRYTLQQLCFGWINLTLAAPSIYLWVGLPLVLRQNGWSGLEIGIFQLASIPAVLKFLFAIPVEKLFGKGRQRYLIWSWITGIPFCLAMLLLAQYEPQQGKTALIVLAFFAAIFATWTDIPVNALAIRIFSSSERFRAGSVRSAATFLGAVLGGGIMLMIYQKLGWKAPFLIMAGSVLLSLIILFFTAKESKSTVEIHVPSAEEWIGFFKRPNMAIWLVLLFGFFPPMAAAWVYLKPMLLDYGIAPNFVAMIAGIGGGAVGALASAWSANIRRDVAHSFVPFVIITNAFVLLILAGVFTFGEGSILAACLGCALLAIAMGITSSLVFSLIMEFSRESTAAFDYGVQSSVFTLGRILVMPIAGALIDKLGYSGMLIFFSCVLLLLLFILSRNKSALQFC
jgi:PAT family beta-lactamase induction signal transducer AmpG